MPEQTVVVAVTPAVPTPTRLRWWTRVRITMMRTLLFLIFSGSFFFSTIPWGRALARSILILPALITFTQPAPLQFFGETITHTQTTITSRSGTAYLDIFAPGSPAPLVTNARGGLVVVSGVGDNRQVPQLVNLLEALARTNLVVVHVTAPDLLYNILSVDDEDAVVQAFEKLQQYPGMQGRHIGLIDFSAGTPAVCFAAADPRIRAQVASVTSFGGYFSTYSFVRAIGRRLLEVDGHSQAWHPNEIPLQVLATMTARYVPTEDGEMLTHAFYDKVSLSDEELHQLSQPTQAAYHILAGDEQEQVDANIAALPERLRAEFDSLEISKAIGQIQAPIYLLHDQGDTSLPFSESRAFDAALTKIHHPHRYVEFHIFDHVQVREGLNVPQLLNDGSQLASILADVVAAES